VRARYVHTNLIARDHATLAAFYTSVFGCVLVPPTRDLFGPALEAGTAIPAAHLRGVHLRMPGHGDKGPTLEIFEYTPGSQPDRRPPRVDRPGLRHIAFEVDDVQAARDEVLAAGGAAVGEVVTTNAGPRSVTWCYVTDPEGNVIELQRWASIL
jgi:catechol 2,3-dioxygenase-like lactoylglutathione lyase family enzyme